MNHLTAIVGHIGGTVLLLVRTLKFIGTLPRQWARFIEILDRPPRENPGLAKLFSRPSAFTDK